VPVVELTGQHPFVAPDAEALRDQRIDQPEVHPMVRQGQPAVTPFLGIDGQIAGEHEQQAGIDRALLDDGDDRHVQARQRRQRFAQQVGVACRTVRQVVIEIAVQEDDIRVAACA
jgi:hypothetical protein